MDLIQRRSPPKEELLRQQQLTTGQYLLVQANSWDPAGSGFLELGPIATVTVVSHTPRSTVGVPQFTDPVSHGSL